MDRTRSAWIGVVAVSGVIFGLLGIAAGGWMFAPVVIIGLILLALPRLRRP